MRVALYARISTKEQDPETQLRDLRRYAAARGFEVVAERPAGPEGGAKTPR